MKMNTLIQKGICPVFIAALFIMAKMRKQPLGHPQMSGHRKCGIHPKEYHSAIERMRPCPPLLGESEQVCSMGGVWGGTDGKSAGILSSSSPSTARWGAPSSHPENKI